MRSMVTYSIKYYYYTYCDFSSCILTPIQGWISSVLLAIIDTKGCVCPLNKPPCDLFVDWILNRSQKRDIKT